MHRTSKKFRKETKEKFGFEPEIHEFPEGTKTAKDAAEAISCELSQIAKSIVMKAGEELVIVITSGSNRVNEKKLAEELGISEKAVRPADAGEVKAKLGWSIGGVPPFCHRSDVRIFFDPDLKNYDTVWAAGGTPKAVFPISPEKLIEYSGAEVRDVVG